jgi:uncharacterized membrane-anchored protein YjiN (DUF445 family)
MRNDRSDRPGTAAQPFPPAHSGLVEYAENAFLEKKLVERKLREVTPFVFIGERFPGVTTSPNRVGRV